MKKLFVVSDIHGYASVFKRALEDAGFDKENENHLLICCGDYIDRGSESRQVIEYLKSIPNKVLIKGNHEDMIEDTFIKKYLDEIDLHNGEDATFESIFGKDCIGANGDLTLDEKKVAEIKEFISGLHDYYETEKYIFVHGWLPLESNGITVKLKRDWRNATDTEWRYARINEWHRAYPRGLRPTDKTLVCGHRTAELACLFDGTRADGDSSVFYGDGMIAIDACTCVSGKVNVLILEE